MDWAPYALEIFGWRSLVARAMSEPITPPREDSSVGFEVNIVGNPLNYTAVGHASASQPLAPPTPESHGMGMDLDELDPKDDSKDDLMDESRSLAPHDDDEDQDMSDGGVPLTNTNVQAGYYHAEAGQGFIDTIGHAGMDVLFDDDYEGLDDGLASHSPPPYGSSAADADEHIEAGLVQEAAPSSETQGPMDIYNVPAAMEVSQQLQHLQDGQAQVDGPSATDDQGQLNLENSTAPFPLPFPSSNLASHEQFQFVSLADISPSNNIPIVVGSANAPHLWSTEGSTPSPAFDILSSHSGSEVNLPLSSSPNVAVGGDDVDSQADLHEVDEQFNLSLVDFLDRWGMSVTREGRRRHRGPDLASVHEQSMVRMNYILRSDLRGDRCDIQGIDWKSLGVSRLEARQMRRQTYRNYTNLRLANQPHVSTKSY